MRKNTLHSSVGVSPLSYPLPLWRYLVLFQSWSQFQSWAVIVVSIALLAGGFMSVLEKPVMPLDVVLSGIFLGSLCSIIMVFPAQFTVSSTSRQSIHFLIDQLKDMRYTEEACATGGALFRQNLPRLLRWNEGDVFIKSDAGLATFRGPRFILAILRLRLVKHIDMQ